MNAQAPSGSEIPREQLILAQVRLMELEDERDELAAQLSTARSQIEETQLLADKKAQELADLERRLAAVSGERHAAETELIRVRADRESEAARRVGADVALARAEAEARTLRERLRAIESSWVWRWTHWLRRDG